MDRWNRNAPAWPQVPGHAVMAWFYRPIDHFDFPVSAKFDITPIDALFHHLQQRCCMATPPFANVVAPCWTQGVSLSGKSLANAF